MVIDRRDKSKGFSLLEILLVIILGLLMFKVILRSYLIFKNIYNTRNSLSLSSESMRFAGFVLWQHIVQAGFSGVRDIANLGLYNPCHKHFGVRGYDNGILPDYLSGKVLKNTDVIVITRVNADFMRLSNDLLTKVDSLRLVTDYKPKVGEFLLISDNRNADLLQVSSYKEGKIYLANKLWNSYSKEHTEVRSFIETTFFVSNSKRRDYKDRSIYSLYVSTNGNNKVELIPGVEDMKILYGIAVGGSQKIDKFLQAGDINKTQLWDKVLAVKIKFKIRDKEVSRWKAFYVRLRQRG